MTEQRIQCTLCGETYPDGDRAIDHLTSDHQDFLAGLLTPVDVPAVAGRGDDDD